MQDYDKTIKFNVLGTEISLCNNNTSYGWQSFATVNDEIYYLGDEYCTTETAINVWQNINGRLLTIEEIWKVYEKELR